MAALPHPIPDHAQPQEHHQKEVMEKDVVDHGISPLLWENDDKPPTFHAEELSAR
jgi:hypothetical protein